MTATAGTTVLGDLDLVDVSADVCEREGVWLDIDASGRVMAFSMQSSQRLECTGHADGITTDQHEMVGVPVTCSTLVGGDVRGF